VSFNLPSDYDPRVTPLRKNSGSNRYYLYYYLPTGQRMIVTAKTCNKLAAAQAGRDVERRLLAGEFTDDELAKMGPGFEASELTIDQGVERYLMITAANKSNKTRERERCDIPRTFKYFKQHGDMLLRDIETATVNDFLFREKAKFSPTTTRNSRCTLKKVFSALIREGSFRHPNPVATAETIRVTKDQAQRSVWIPYEHFLLLLSAATQSRSPINFQDMLELNWEVALRRDEMLTLEWHQYRPQERVLRIVNKPEFPTRLGKGWSPKWRRERIIPLTDKAVEIIERQQRRISYAYLGKDKDRQLVPVNLIFPMRIKRGEKVTFLQCETFKKAWAGIVKRAKLERYDYNWHDVRRSWNRYAAERGIPISYRAAFLGHRIEVNESNYETPMGFEFLRQRIGGSMAGVAKELTETDPVLIQFPISATAG